MDQNKIGGVINQLNKSGFGEHIYCVLCGRMTPDQKKMVRERSTLDTQLFIDIMTWFVQNSGHSRFKNISVPEECPQPLLVEDRDMKVELITSHWLKILQEPHLYVGRNPASA
jgi:hypothetical protein